MTNEVQHVSSRCGGGKSHFTIQELYQFITKNPDETVVFASKTNELTAQNHKALLSEDQASPVPNRNFQRIDISTTPRSSSVLKELHKRLDQRQGGVVFISHSILQNVDPTKMQGVRLIIDEVPSILVQHLRISYEQMDHDHSWESYITTRVCRHSRYRIASLDPAVCIDAVQRRIDNIRQRIDNRSTPEVASLLEFLLEGHEVMYTSSSNQDSKVINLYLATQWQQLEALVMNTKKLAILSAQLKDTLVGFVLEKVINVVISPTTINDTLILDELHQNHAVIYPIIEGNKWSAVLKKKKANEALLYQGASVVSEQQVMLYSQEVAQSILQGEPSLLILNNRDDEHECWKDYPIERISSESHGMNSYTGYDNAVFLASKRPDAHETQALGLFAIDHGFSREDIMEVVLKERCYESAYQCIARTSVRNPTANPEVKHIYVVPDEAHAEYVAEWFSPGMATIDRSYLHQLQPTTASQSKDDAMFNLIVQIRTDFNAKKGKLNHLLCQYNLNEKKYKRYVAKFRSTLEARGLVQPRRASTKTGTKAAA